MVLEKTFPLDGELKANSNMSKQIRKTNEQTVYSE